MSYYTSNYTGSEIDAFLASVDYATLTEKFLPHDNDMILLQDSQADGAPKKAKIANLPGGSGGTGDMMKATYDTDNDGSVDKADAIEGVASAGNSKYYGTNSSGTAGFYDLPSGGTSFDIHALTSESTLADTDEMPFYDVSATAARKTLWSNIKSVLKTYFDTVYTAALLVLTGYSKPSSTSAIAATDTINQAFGKLEKALDGKASTAPSVVDRTASYTLGLTDAGTVQKCSSASTITVTVPLNSSVAFPTNTEIVLVRYGTGAVTLSPASGVTLNSSGSKKSINAQYEAVTLKKLGTDEWLLIGALAT